MVDDLRRLIYAYGQAVLAKAIDLLHITVAAVLPGAAFIKVFCKVLHGKMYIKIPRAGFPAAVSFVA